MEQAKILIIEDDETLRKMYSERFQMEGFSVDGASNGEEGLDYAKSGVYNLIILDVMMPKMSGMEVLEQLKAMAETKDVPVVMLTALSALQIKSLVAGAVEYLIKSENSVDEVVSKVKAVLAREK